MRARPVSSTRPSVRRCCRPATVALLEEWRELLTDPRRAYAPAARSRGGLAVTDQLALNMVLQRGMAPVAPMDGTGDWRVIAAANGSIALLPLPALTFVNGHVAFYQHLPQLHGVTVLPGARRSTPATWLHVHAFGL